MKYWIHQNTILEGWKDRALYAVNPEKIHIRLSKEERYFLLTCDGREQEPREIADSLLSANVITCDEQLGQKPDILYHPMLCRNTAVIAITGRCNYKCRHCIAADGKENSNEELSLATLTALFKELPGLGVKTVWLTGGEPMVHPNFPEIVEAASDNGLCISRILTNGSLLTSKSLDHLKKCHQSPCFGISFDGLGTHDWMRCHKGAEALSLAAIDLAIGNGFKVMPHINVNHVTAPRIIETCRCLVKEHGCKSLRLIPTSRSPRWKMLAGPEDNITYDEYFALMLELIRTAAIENWQAFLDIRSLPDAHLPGRHHALEQLKNPPSVKQNAFIMHWCARTREQLFIAHDGRVLPCNAYEGTSKQYGFLTGDDISIHHRSLRDILTDSEYVRFCTEKVKNHFEDVEKCRCCKWAGICYGGCPLFALGNRLIISDENPNCAFFRGGWAERYIALLEELRNF